MTAVDAVHDLNMLNDIFHLYWEEDAALHMCTNILHFKDLGFLVCEKPNVGIVYTFCPLYIKAQRLYNEKKGKQRRSRSDAVICTV